MWTTTSVGLHKALHQHSHSYYQHCYQARRTPRQIKCKSVDGSHESSHFHSSLRKGFAPERKKPTRRPNTAPQEQPSKRVVLGNDLPQDSWKALDAKVNKYPGERSFTAIGTGGDEFRDAMVLAVSQVVGTVRPDCVSVRPSSQGSYTSVRVGPVVVQNADQVVAIYAAMKQDARLKWYM